MRFDYYFVKFLYLQVEKYITDKTPGFRTHHATIQRHTYTRLGLHLRYFDHIKELNSSTFITCMTLTLFHGHWKTVTVTSTDQCSSHSVRQAFSFWLVSIKVSFYSITAFLPLQISFIHVTHCLQKGESPGFL